MCKASCPERRVVRKQRITRNNENTVLKSGATKPPTAILSKLVTIFPTPIPTRENHYELRCCQ